MSEADLLTPAPAKKRGSRRRWLLVVVLVLLPVLMLVGIYCYVGHLADLDLQDALAEADRLDPGWRLDDLLLHPRTEYASDDNSALQVVRAKALLPSGWGAKDEFQRDVFNDVFAFPPRPHQLDAEQQRLLREEMAKSPAALAEARKLADMPHGKLPSEYTHEDWIWSRPMATYCQDARAVAYLLQSDTLLLAQEGDTEGALRSTRAIVNIGWSVGDEPPPNLVSLSHFYCRWFAARGLERVLSQGEPSSPALADLQRLLEEEEAVNLLLCYMRGTRAAMDEWMANVQNGNARLADLLNSLNLSAGLHDPEVVEVTLIRYSAGLKTQRAAVLRYMTQLVESARLPPEEQTQRNKQLEAEARNHGLLVRALAPGGIRLAENYQRHLALLRSAIVALAAERFRRVHDHWPTSLDVLVTEGLLKQVPADPYDGAPLRYRSHDDRVVIYSIGMDLQDNGGTYPGKSGWIKGTDVGFTLWNAAERRLLPLPAKEPPDPEPTPGEPEAGSAPPPVTKEPRP
jgi:hypothetical protein